ncbi:Nucleotidyltransferase/DNA polymerase involved in DNA repair [Metschnikowia aff. pulcherrima]|uniref:DNA repair protein REV1 n=1 Tax=Metschnikowia aff. pulcherrima TaxID=2163413 RepID=A0A4P6XPK8_9ASCO|nr:Nucleotidyltransferase/DNA polymerase involved in DNA repair [Metschnikowia aff. pulcherrima]
MADENTYPSFLSLLNELQLIAHINAISQFSQQGQLSQHIRGGKNDQNEANRLDAPVLLTFFPDNNNEIENAENLGINGSFEGTSTPTIKAGEKLRHPFLCLALSLASDPFDDNLDSQLIKLGTGLAGNVPNTALISASLACSDGPVPGNQLALLQKSDLSETNLKDNAQEVNSKKSVTFATGDGDDTDSDERVNDDSDVFGDGNLDSILDDPVLGGKPGVFLDNSDGSGNANIFADSHDDEVLASEDMIGLDGFQNGNGGGSQNTHPLQDKHDPNHTNLHAEVADAGENLDDPETSIFAEVGPQHEFGDYDTYFENKYRKQQVADRDFIRWEKQRRVANGQLADIPRVFAGCRIFVNGNTTPTLATIHRLVILHGGTFLSHLLNKGAATHIICDRLTPRKRVQFKNYRVVKAQWIADCVAQEKLLDWKAYRLIDDIEPLQKRLGFSKVGDNHEEALLPAAGSGSSDEKGDAHDRHESADVFSEEAGISEDIDYGELPETTEAPGPLMEPGFDRHNSATFHDIAEDNDHQILPITNAGPQASKPAAGIQSDDKDNGAIVPEILTRGTQPGPSIDNNINLEYDFSQVPKKLSQIVEMAEPQDDNPFLDPMLEGRIDDSREAHRSQEQHNSFMEMLSASKQTNLSQLKVSKPRQAFAQMDAKHPDFLKHFFANSRLHHLSTWKADLKSKFLRLIARGYEGPPRIVLAQPVILHIDFDCFFATASALKHPHLDIKRDPIAVSHGGKSSDIASCNYVARDFGVSNGMWLGRALEMCPDLKVVDYDFEAYEKFSHEFYSYLVLQKIFDSIFPVLIDEVLVDASSHCHSDNICEKVNELCTQIRRDVLARTNCPVSIGAALNVLLAKLAIRKAKPDGHYHLYEDVQDFLDDTDVRQLPGVGSSLARRISEELGHLEYGPIPIREVRTLSRERLTRVFGDKTGLKIFDNCRGHDLTKIHLDTSSSEALLGRKTVSVDVNYGIRFSLFSEVETFLMSLAKELHSRLIDLGACGSSITLRLAKRAPDAPVVTPKFMGLGKCIFVSRSSSLGVATNDWGLLGSEMKALLRSFNIPPQDLRGIAVSMSKLEDIEAVKKQRQQKLVFLRKLAPQKTMVLPPIMSQDIPFAERVTGGESVDWNVFNQLPEEIRFELKKELLRRGIPVSAKERSPRKRNLDGSAKVYLQQMFPSQAYGEFKVKRVIESPTKKKKLESLLKRRKSELPVPVPAIYNDTVSYDESVLNEIPSSIRNEFMEELEWQKRHKLLGFVSVRTKMQQKQEIERRIKEQVLDAQWLAKRERSVTLPSFNESINNYHELAALLREWVKLTVQDEGPHSDDVAMLEDYLQGVFEKGGISRISNLLKVMVKELEAQESIIRICSQSETKHILMRAGVDDWRRHLTRMKGKFTRACANVGVVI